MSAAVVVAAVFAVLAVIVLWTLYTQAGGFSPKRFPATTAALGAIRTSFGVTRGALELTPVSVRIVPAQGVPGRDGYFPERVWVRAPAPGSPARFLLRAAPKTAAPPSGAWVAGALVPVGPVSGDLESLLSSEVRAGLAKLAQRPREASVPTPVPASLAGHYRDAAQAAGSSATHAPWPVELLARRGEWVLYFESPRVTDAELHAAVCALARGARRALTLGAAARPGTGLAGVLWRTALLALLFAGAGYVTLGQGGFLDGVDGVVFRRYRFIGRYSTSYRLEVFSEQGRDTISVPVDAFAGCGGESIRRERYAMTIRCGANTYWDTSPAWGVFLLAVAAGVVAWGARDARKLRASSR